MIVDAMNSLFVVVQLGALTPEFDLVACLMSSLEK
jgi:hypothetical protein